MEKNPGRLRADWSRPDPISYSGRLAQRFFACLAVVARHSVFASAEIITTKNKKRHARPLQLNRQRNAKSAYLNMILDLVSSSLPPIFQCSYRLWGSLRKFLYTIESVMKDEINSSNSLAMSLYKEPRYLKMRPVNPPTVELLMVPW